MELSGVALALFALVGWFVAVAITGYWLIDRWYIDRCRESIEAFSGLASKALHGWKQSEELATLRGRAISRLVDRYPVTVDDLRELVAEEREFAAEEESQ
jgi:hypothetical protein